MKSFYKTYGLTLLSGALLALSFPRLALFPLAWAALVPLFYRADSMTARQGALHFFLAGFLFHLMLLHWLMTNVYWAGSAAFWGYVAVCAYLAAWWAGGGALWCWMRGRGALGGGPLGLALMFVAIEYAQARALTGFGWSAIGYSQGRDFYVLQLAAAGGVGLITFVVVLVNALVAKGLAMRGRTRLARLTGAAGVVAACHLAGAVMLAGAPAAEPMMHVGILQPDFPLEMKWDQEYTVEMVRNAAEKTRALQADHKIDLFVWPEAVIMDSIENPAIREVLSALTSEAGTPLFTGSTRFVQETGGEANSSYLIDASGEIVDHYDKVHLVPYGEYVPFGKYMPFIQSFVPAVGDAEHGRHLKLLETGGRKFAPLICFEVLFAPQAEQLRAMGADYLVVITNLGWFGSSSAIPQELELARMRAVETRLPVVHSANTGISGVFDPYGRFSGANGVFDASGRFATFNQNIYGPEDTIMQRVAGVLPVSPPARQPLPHGQAIFNYLALGLAGLMVIAAAVKRRRADAGAA